MTERARERKRELRSGTQRLALLPVSHLQALLLLSLLCMPVRTIPFPFQSTLTCTHTLEEVEMGVPDKERREREMEAAFDLGE